MSDPLSPEEFPEDELAAPDDAIIGRAFRWSMLVFVLIGGAIGLMAWRLKQPAAVAPPRENVVAPPAEVRRDVNAPPMRFKDVTQAAGIEFIHENGAYGDKLLPETLGGGCTFFDYDGDGDQDILFVNSCRWPWDEGEGVAAQRLEAGATANGRAEHPLSAGATGGREGAHRLLAGATHGAGTMALYRNDGSGRFEDVTAGSGLDVSFYGMGCAVGDYDNDGDADVFITAVGKDRLFRNDGPDAGPRFADVTKSAGVAGDADAWSTGAGFLDYDNDADLDLFVCNYVKWSRETDFAVDYRLVGVGRAYGPPTNFEGAHCRLYRNDGGPGGAARFIDVSEAAGIRVNNPATGAPMGKALAIAPVDVDGDGFIDVLVANDTVQNFLFHNRGDGTFAEIGAASGVGFDRMGNATGAMGSDSADYRNDKTLGFAIGNFANEMTSLYLAGVERLQFNDVAIVEGIGAPSRLSLKFGLFFFDCDLDGRLDLLQCNGHLEEEINTVQPSQHYRQPAQLFWNAGPQARASFVEALRESLGDLATPIVGRGAAYADIDADGDLDVLLTQIGGRPLLLRNDQALGNHWLRVKLVGGAGLHAGRGCNRDAIGAWIELTAGGVTQRRQVMPTKSYLSQVELPVTFGLGASGAIDELRIYWPDGSVQPATVPEIDREIVIMHGGG